MRGDKKGLGQNFYFEWMHPIKDYFVTCERNEVYFEVVFPIIVAVLSVVVCTMVDKVDLATRELAALLMSLTSILIGFSIMLVTLLLTGGGEGIKKLQSKFSKKTLNNNPMTLFQKLHVQFVYTLIVEIILLLSIMFFYFLTSFLENGRWETIFLFLFVFMIMNILLSILRGVTNIYFSYYNS